MTVDELIEKLQMFKCGSFVYVDSDDGSYREVTEVKVAIVGWPDKKEDIITIEFEQ